MSYIKHKFEKNIPIFTTQFSLSDHTFHMKCWQQLHIIYEVVAMLTAESKKVRSFSNQKEMSKLMT